MKNIYLMSVNQLRKVPLRKWDQEIVCDSLVIIPTKLKHDSGFMCMSFIACKDKEPICRISGCSDVIHLDGIGGFGYKWIDKGTPPQIVKPSGWNIDCLQNGLLRIFCNEQIIIGISISSLEIWCKHKPIECGQPCEAK